MTAAAPAGRQGRGTALASRSVFAEARILPLRHTSEDVSNPPGRHYLAA